MKQLMRRLILGAAMVLVAGTAFAADPVFGVWKTKPDDNGELPPENRTVTEATI